MQESLSCSLSKAVAIFQAHLLTSLNSLFPSQTQVCSLASGLGLCPCPPRAPLHPESWLLQRASPLSTCSRHQAASVPSALWTISHLLVPWPSCRGLSLGTRAAQGPLTWAVGAMGTKGSILPNSLYRGGNRPKKMQ